VTSAEFKLNSLLENDSEFFDTVRMIGMVLEKI